MAVSVKRTGGKSWKKALEPYRNSGRMQVKIGVLEGATYPDGTPVAAIAAVHEFGTAHVPARSFMRSTLAAKKESWGKGLAYQLKASGNVKTALTALGEVASKDIQKAIEDGLSPKLKDETVAAKIRRGKSNTTVNNKRNLGISRPELPLVATGTLQEAIDYEVVEL